MTAFNVDEIDTRWPLIFAFPLSPADTKTADNKGALFSPKESCFLVKMYENPEIIKGKPTDSKS